MATIIDLGSGQFIAGDPATELGEGEHWCDYCGGQGLEWIDGGEPVICWSCYGSGVTTCTDTACILHHAT